MLEVREYGEKVLREKARKIEEINEDIRKLASDMFETCYETEGVGLAAPQVGVSLRMYVLSIPPEDDETTDRKKFTEEVIINPEIISRVGKQTGEEGCLSIPGVYEIVERAEEVVVRYTNLDGEEKELKGSGLLARAIQHEGDHLDGTLFVDKLPPLKKQLVKKKLNRAYGVRW